MNKDLRMPPDLSEVGKKAYDTVLKVLVKEGMTHTGGCRAFYSPSEWEKRGEKWGTESPLIVVYDGGEVGQFFNMNKAREDQYTFYAKMQKALRNARLYSEECTHWYSVICES